MIPVLHGVWAAAGGLVGDFEHIETQTVGAGGAASITFSSIPGTYKHLQIRGISRSSRSDGTNPDNDVNLRFNSDSGSNYALHYLYGNGTSASSGAASSVTFGTCVSATSKSFAGSNTFGATVIDLVDYASTSKNKTVRALSGIDNNGGGGLSLTSSLWMNSGSAISSVLLYPAGTSATFAQYSTFALYGVK